MENNTYGYVWVSKPEQNEACQLAAMLEFGMEEEKIIGEKLSGKDFHSPRYQCFVKTLRQGMYWWSRASTGWAGTTMNF